MFLALPGGTRTKTTYMEFKAFLLKAGIEGLPWFTSQNGHEFAPTPMGTVFKTKGYNPKGKVKYLIPGTDDNGRNIWRITNQKPKMEC